MSLSPLSRFSGFVRRFAPFWLVWLLIALWPASREPLGVQLLGSPLTPNLNPPWREDLRADRRFDAFAAVSRKPGDLNARIWRLSQMLESKTGGFDPLGEPNRRVYRPGELRREARAIRDDFSAQKWLSALSLRAMSSQISKQRNSLSSATATELAALTREAERGEPGNAYYPLLEADFWHRSGDLDAMWAALARAATAKFLDPHDLDFGRAIVRAHDAARALTLEEKDALWNERLGFESLQVGPTPTFLGHEARVAQRRGDHARALEIALILGRIGDLMQRGPQTRAMAANGQGWKAEVWTLLYRSWPPKPRRKPRTWARTFGDYARAHGRPDIMAQSIGWQKRQSQLYRLSIWAPGAGYVPPTSSRKNAMARAAEWRIAGVVVVVHLLFVAVAWMLVQVILWRGVGAPSNRLQRTVPAGAMAALSVGFSLWAWRQFEIMDAARWTPTQERFAAAVATVATVAFFGPPFLLAVWAAAAMLWTRRREFLQPARIETELRLSPGQVVILRSGPAIVCTAALMFTLGFWLFYLGLVAFDITSFDLLGWLPDNGKTMNWDGTVPTEVLFGPIVYLLFCDFVAFLLWFNKWRYYAGRESRPLTHGGLRAWKEMIGVYLVFGSIVLLGVSLAGAPHRAQAMRDLETRMVRGDLPP